MAKKTEHLSTAEFSKLTGVPASTITRLIRDGQLQATKKSGKWMIPRGQSSLKVLQKYQPSKSTASAKAAPKKSKPAAVSRKKAPADAEAAKSPPPSAAPKPSIGTGKTYSVSEFSQMTYLTDFGVTEWLKAGRLKGSLDESGQWRIDGSSLDLPAVKRLVR